MHTIIAYFIIAAKAAGGVRVRTELEQRYLGHPAGWNSAPPCSDRSANNPGFPVPVARRRP